MSSPFFRLFCLGYHLDSDALLNEPFASGKGRVHLVADRKGSVAVGKGFDGADFHVASLRLERDCERAGLTFRHFWAP